MGYAGRRGIEPPAELVLEGVADDDYPLLWHVKGDAAGGVAREMYDSELGGEGNEVTIFEARVDGDRIAGELGKGGLGNGCEQWNLQGVGGGGYTLDDVSLGGVNSDGYGGFGDKFCKATAVIGVGVGDDNAANLIEGEPAFREAANNRPGAARETGVDEYGVTGFGEDSDSGADGPDLEYGVGYFN